MCKLVAGYSENTCVKGGHINAGCFVHKCNLQFSSRWGRMVGVGWGCRVREGGRGRVGCRVGGEGNLRLVIFFTEDSLSNWRNLGKHL